MRFAAMTAADVDEVLDIERRSFAEPWSRGMFFHELKLPFSTTILARADESPHELLGYACWWLIGDEVEILNVAAHPDRRRAGIGRALVDLIIQAAYANHAHMITLEVQRDNAAAIALYRACGFIETGVRRNYYGRGTDALLMTWTPPAADTRTAAS